MPTDTTFAGLGDQRFVSLTTFRRSGVGVPTPVWVARDGDALVVTTPEGSGKVKRLRHDARVELRPCNRRGRVDAGARPVTGTAAIITDEATTGRLTDLIRSKYGLEFRLVMAVERLVRSGEARRVLLRITPD
ncbi:PPOX class F420-dependent oxidoreductase [Oryzihumus sp.]